MSITEALSTESIMLETDDKSSWIVYTIFMDSTVIIEELYVSGMSRRTGIGRELVNKVLKENSEVPCVFVTCTKTSKAFWEKLGFDFPYGSMHSEMKTQEILKS